MWACCMCVSVCIACFLNSDFNPFFIRVWMCVLFFCVCYSFLRGLFNFHSPLIIISSHHHHHSVQWITNTCRILTICWLYQFRFFKLLPRFLAVIFFFFFAVVLCACMLYDVSGSCVRSKHFSTHTDWVDFRSRYWIVCFFFGSVPQIQILSSFLQCTSFLLLISSISFSSSSVICIMGKEKQEQKRKRLKITLLYLAF